MNSQNQVTVTIDTTVTPQPYSRMLFGGFLEHFDSQIYGGGYEPGSPLADAAGFRLDVMAALRELKSSIIRWPGGCFVDSYHWQTGVGRARQPHGDFRWGVVEPNAFGTHEFVEFCRRLGAEPYICQNGLASPRENLDWVDYCNATSGPMAELRKANGYPDPLDVKFWSVGNERYDKAYINRVRETVQAMKGADPTVQVTCSGSQGDGGRCMPGVKPYLLETAGQYLDYVSVHNYWLDRGDPVPHYDYLTAITTCDMPEAYLRIVTESLAKAGHGRLQIAFDEWNLRAWQHPGFPRDGVEDYEAPEVRERVAQRQRENDLPSQYTMADALFSASFLNACLRYAGQVTMANIAPLVNTRGPLFVHPVGIVKRTHFHALAMYANLLQECMAATTVESAKLAHGDQSVAMVDAVATVDKSGQRWSVAVINRHPDMAVNCMLNLGGIPLNGSFHATQLSGDSPDAYNDIEHPNRVSPRSVDLRFVDGMVSLPPHSLIIVIRLEGGNNGIYRMCEL